MTRNLEQIRQTLRTTLNNPAMFSLINTRLILRTGVDLGELKPTDDSPDNVAKVLSALGAMGFTLTPDSK